MQHLEEKPHQVSLSKMSGIEILKFNFCIDFSKTDWGKIISELKGPGLTNNSRSFLESYLNGIQKKVIGMIDNVTSLEQFIQSIKKENLTDENVAFLGLSSVKEAIKEALVKLPNSNIENSSSEYSYTKNEDCPPIGSPIIVNYTLVSGK